MAKQDSWELEITTGSDQMDLDPTPKPGYELAHTVRIGSEQYAAGVSTDYEQFVLIVEPHIDQVGDVFSRIVLGQRAEGAELSHVLTDRSPVADRTVFLARVAMNRGLQMPTRPELGQRLVRRLSLLVNNPEVAPMLHAQSPFNFRPVDGK